MTPNDVEKKSVSSRITFYNKIVEQQHQWQQINPILHSMPNVPKAKFNTAEYGRASSNSRSERRALQAEMQSLQEMLQLCELIYQQGETVKDAYTQMPIVCIKFGKLFQLYNDISDKLVGTLLRARKHKFLNFVGETLFQGRDNETPVQLQREFDELRHEIVTKLNNLRSEATEKQQNE